MSKKSLFSLGLAALFLIFIGCAAAPPKPEGPPPPQNMVGSTDELQLVTELSLDLAKKYGSERLLVVLGIDDTLLQQTGERCDAGDAQPRPVQPDSADQVSRMQDANLKVIVMTERAPECIEETLEELRNSGFSFAGSAWPGSSVTNEFYPAGGARQAAYRSGVLFANGQDSGVVLTGLLEESGAAYPALVIAVDNNRKNLSAFMRAFSNKPAKLHTWHYTRSGEVAQVAAQ